MCIRDRYKRGFSEPPHSRIRGKYAETDVYKRQAFARPRLRDNGFVGTKRRVARHGKAAQDIGVSRVEEVVVRRLHRRHVEVRGVLHIPHERGRGDYAVFVDIV